MNIRKLRSDPNLPYKVNILYFAIVVSCILIAFDYAGSINSNGLLALILFTLPWSLVSILFAWALIHGAGLEFFTVMYLAFAGLNSLILHFIMKKKFLMKPVDRITVLDLNQGR